MANFRYFRHGWPKSSAFLFSGVTTDFKILLQWLNCICIATNKLVATEKLIVIDMLSPHWMGLRFQLYLTVVRIIIIIIIIIRYFFIYKLLTPTKHGVQSQLVKKSSQKELQSKARWVRLNTDTGSVQTKGITLGSASLPILFNIHSGQSVQCALISIWIHY